MAANAIGVDGGEPARSRVVILPARRPLVPPARQAPGVRGSGSAAIIQLGRHFTALDHAALAEWASDIVHGYDRLHVERCVLEDDQWASYALIYVRGQAWSTWGLTRSGDHIEVWQCATGQTVGLHTRMADALASLPPAAEYRRVPGKAAGGGRAARHPSRRGSDTVRAAADPTRVPGRPGSAS